MNKHTTEFFIKNMNFQLKDARNISFLLGHYKRIMDIVRCYSLPKFTRKSATKNRNMLQFKNIYIVHVHLFQKCCKSFFIYSYISLFIHFILYTYLFWIQDFNVLEFVSK